MKRILWCLTAVLAVAGLFACAKKTESTETTPTAAAANPTETPAATGKEEKPDMQKAMAMMGEMAKNVDTKDAPEYLKQSVTHIQAITKLMKDNLGDCSKLTTAVAGYIEKNKAELESMRKAGEDFKTKLKDEDQMKLAQQMMALMGSAMGDVIQVNMEFQKRCPGEAQKLAEQMKNIQVR